MVVPAYFWHLRSVCLLYTKEPITKMLEIAVGCTDHFLFGTLVHNWSDCWLMGDWYLQFSGLLWLGDWGIIYLSVMYLSGMHLILVLLSQLSMMCPLYLSITILPFEQCNHGFLFPLSSQCNPIIFSKNGLLVVCKLILLLAGVSHWLVVVCVLQLLTITEQYKVGSD